MTGEMYGKYSKKKRKITKTFKKSKIFIIFFLLLGKDTKFSDNFYKIKKFIYLAVFPIIPLTQ